MDENTRQMDGRPVTGSRALLLLTFENMLCSCLVFTSSGSRWPKAAVVYSKPPKRKISATCKLLHLL